MKKKLCVDLDDVLCNYTKHFVYCIKQYPQFNPYPQSRLGFFLELEPIDGAIETIKKLKEHFDIHFVTRPSIKNLHCFIEKAQWISKYFGEDMLNKLTITSYKQDFSGDYLIDDVIWEGFKGTQL